MTIKGIFTLCLMLGTAPSLWAGSASPGETLQELEMQLNSRSVTALVGNVDFDFLFAREGVHTSSLETVQRQQRGELVAVKADSIRALEAELASLEQQVAREGKAGVDTARMAGIAQRLQRFEGGVAVKSFVADTTNPELQSYLRLLRTANDRRGDPKGFDLSAVDVGALERHPRPKRLQDREDVVLCVQVARPAPIAAPIVTQIAEERPLAERRVMRLDLRTFYTDWSPDTYWDLEIEVIEVKGDAATARISWSFSDQPDGRMNGKQKGRLALRKTPDGWKIEQCWGFLEKVMASR